MTQNSNFDCMDCLRDCMHYIAIRETSMNARKAATALALCMAANGAAWANLNDRGTTTFDDITGLEWLDLTQSGGYSFNEMVAQSGAGSAFAGYRHATSAETEALLAQFGISSSRYGVVATPNAVSSFGSLFGLNFGGVGAPYGFAALVGDTVEYDGAMYHPLFYVFASGYGNTTMNWGADFAGGVDAAYDVTVALLGDQKPSYPVAHFMVRDAFSATPVPEPAGWALMLGGLGALAALRRRQQRKV